MTPNSPGEFSDPTAYSVGTGPTSVCPADLNGDGFLDLATCNYHTDNASVLLNNGDGTYGAAAHYAAGNEPSGICAGDFDGDGDMDLAVANYVESSMSILTNDGLGSFTSGGTFETGYFPTSVVAADFDNDGYVDLATGNYGKGVSVLLSHGDGTFLLAQDIWFMGFGGRGICAGDFNGDGHIDLAAAMGGTGGPPGTGMCVCINNGDATFDTTAYGEFPNDMAEFIVAGDVDGDGDVDLVSNDAGFGNVLTWRNDGNGIFASATTSGESGSLSPICAGDFDGDGDLDMVTYNAINFNDGSGNFTAVSTIFVGGSCAGDFDNDGDLDVAGVSWSHSELEVAFNSVATGCCAIRGDIDHNGTGPDIADLVYLVNYMFNGGPVPPCEESGLYIEADVNGDATGPDIADLVYLVNYMFNGGPAPVPCP